MRIGSNQIAGYIPFGPTLSTAQALHALDVCDALPTPNGIAAAFRQTANLPVEAAPFAMEPFVFDHADETYIITASTVQIASSGTVVYSFPPRSGVRQFGRRCYRWTKARVGGYSLLCHPLAPVICVDDCGEWSHFTSADWSGPVYAVAEYECRAVYLLEDTIIWSEIDAPKDVTPNRDTGAGFQSLKKITGHPLTLIATQDVLYTFTTGGILQTVPAGNINYTVANQPVVGAVTFTHKVYKTDALPCDPKHITQMGDNIIWSTSAGLHSTGSKEPALLNGELSAYIRRERSSAPANLSYVASHNLLFIELDYQRNFVVDMGLERFGMFCIGASTFYGTKQGIYAVHHNKVITLHDPQQGTLISYVKFAPILVPELDASQIYQREFAASNITILSATAEAVDIEANEVRLNGDIVDVNDDSQAPACVDYAACETDIKFTVEVASADFHITGVYLNGRVRGGIRR